MRPIDIYALPFSKQTTCLGVLKGFYYDHLSEFSKKYWRDSYFNYEEINTRITIKTHVNHDFDGRRIWAIRSVWLDGLPVMIIQNAGREGDDHRERYITSKKRFLEMLGYMETLMSPEDRKKYGDIGSFEDIAVQEYEEFREMSCLTEFYGYKIPYVFDEYH